MHVAAQLALAFPEQLPTEFSVPELSRKLEPLRVSDRVYAWDLELVRKARDAQMRGDFRTSASLAEAVKTDPAIFGALLNRIAPHRGLARLFRGVNRRIVAEAEETFGPRGESLPTGTVADVFEWLVQLGVFVGQNRWTTRDDGGRLDVRLEPWPMRAVWYDWTTGELKTHTTEGIKTITHGDGRWVVAYLHGAQPWHWGAVKAIGVHWATRAFHVRDRSLNSETHGEGKYIGKLPEGVGLDTKTGLEFAEMVQGLRERRSGGVHPHGAEVDMLEAMSQMWQVFREAITSLDSDIARAYLGQDGSITQEGGNYIKAAQLAGVRQDIVEGDIVAVSAALKTGLLRPWSIVNFGRDVELEMTWALPDPDEDARRESYGKRTDAFNKAIGEYRKNGFVVDDALVRRVAGELGIDPPSLSPEGPPQQETTNAT